MSAIRPFAVTRLCGECPWRTSAEPGHFPAERYRSLADTAQPGTYPCPVFACHMTPEGEERACAGFLAAVGWDNNEVRIAVITGHLHPDLLAPQSGLYPTYRALAEANGVDRDDPALRRLPDAPA